jgi:transposase-like protein
LDFYSGCAWDLKKEKSDLYATLEELNKDYTKISKHMTKSRTELLKDISYEKVKKYFETTRDIWKWVLEREGATDDIEYLFDNPSYLLEK